LSSLEPLLQVIRVDSTIHHTFVSYFPQFNILEAPTSVNLILGSVWIAVVSEIWRHRNKHIFKGGVIDHSEIFSMVQLKVWSWVTSKVISDCFSFSDWCLKTLV